MSRYSAKLDQLGFALPYWGIAPTEELITRFEQRFSLELLADYREFLFDHAGVCGSAVCSFLEPTPLGEETQIVHFYGFTPPSRDDNLAGAQELLEAAPRFVAIGENPGSSVIVLACEGPDTGSVYLHDSEGRSSWPDEHFYQRYPNLALSIREYLELRKKDLLPAKEEGYDDLYLLARSFDELIDSLRPTTTPVAEGEPLASGKDPDWLARAIASCDDVALQELIATGKLNAPLHYGRTPMQIAAACNQKAVQWLLAAGADPQGALIDAANNGRADIIPTLLDQGSNLEERRDGMTPLMWAVRFFFDSPDTLETIRVLLQRGANVNAVSDDGQSVLSLAGGQRSGWFGGTKGPPKVIRLLESAGAKLNPRN